MQISIPFTFSCRDSYKFSAFPRPSLILSLRPFLALCRLSIALCVLPVYTTFPGWLSFLSLLPLSLPPLRSSLLLRFICRPPSFLCSLHLRALVSPLSCHYCLSHCITSPFIRVFPPLSPPSNHHLIALLSFPPPFTRIVSFTHSSFSLLPYLTYILSLSYSSSPPFCPVTTLRSSYTALPSPRPVHPIHHPIKLTTVPIYSPLSISFHGLVFLSELSAYLLSPAPLASHC